MKCENCGTIHEANFCPNCGMGAHETLNVCPRCGNKTRDSFCSKCGYSFIAQPMAQPMPMPAMPIPQYYEAPNTYVQTKASKKKTIWTIVLLIIFPPLGILLTWVLMKGWSQKTKIIVSAVSNAWFAFVLIRGAIGNAHTPVSNTSSYTSSLPRINKAYSLNTNAEFESLGFMVDKTWRFLRDEAGDNYYFNKDDASNGFISIIQNASLVGEYSRSDFDDEAFKQSIERMKQGIAERGKAVSFDGNVEKTKVAELDARVISYEELYSDAEENITDEHMYIKRMVFFDEQMNLFIVSFGVPFDRKNEYTDLLKEFASRITIMPTAVLTTAPARDRTADWKKFLKDYEAWVNTYNAFMKKYMENPADLRMLADYAKLMEKTIEWEKSADAWEDELSDAEWAEFYKEYTRITLKMIDGLY